MYVNIKKYVYKGMYIDINLRLLLKQIYSVLKGREPRMTRDGSKQNHCVIDLVRDNM